MTNETYLKAIAQSQNMFGQSICVTSLICCYRNYQMCSGFVAGICCTKQSHCKYKW